MDRITKAVEIQIPFTVRIGNRLYAKKRILDAWLTKISGTGKRVSETEYICYK